ncbi:MAG: class I SAM-dependent methyltransferase [Bacteroidetes bacterium]|nr:class I SAM-dependent methyltransferase [Bacteroidota bacterium]
MIDYTTEPLHKIKAGDKELSSFITSHDNNIDEITVQSFGEEWERFNDFSSEELESIGNEYFDIVSDEHISAQSNVLDVGCGSGRWTKFISSKVKFVEAIDPSSAVIQAAKMNDKVNNVRVTQASVENIPFGDNSFDFVFSLGVLHHIPDTQSAMNACVRKLKPGGYFLVYLYYNLDNRGFLFRFLFQLANGLRSFISKMPAKLKAVVCDIIATLIYFPFAKFALAIKKIAPKSYAKIPLSYYHDKSFYVMRNDSLDRFGTPLEQRFTKEQIHQMMINAGLVNIQFSDNAPFGMP